MYYYDKFTQKAMWHCPKLLTCANHLEGKTSAASFQKTAKRRNPKNRRRPKPYLWTKTEAALVMQGLYRQHQSRYLIQRLLRIRYKKFYDPASKKSYYHDNTNQKVRAASFLWSYLKVMLINIRGQVFWSKPLIFHDWDVDQKPAPRRKNRRCENLEVDRINFLIYFKSPFQVYSQNQARLCIYRKQHVLYKVITDPVGRVLLSKP